MMSHSKYDPANAYKPGDLAFKQLPAYEPADGEKPCATCGALTKRKNKNPEQAVTCSATCQATRREVMKSAWEKRYKARLADEKLIRSWGIRETS